VLGLKRREKEDIGGALLGTSQEGEDEPRRGRRENNKAT
jgi:hypothetical protein